MQTVFEDTLIARHALPPKQLQQYSTDGYLLVSGLIPGLVAKKDKKAMWNLMKMDPNDVQTWDQILPEAEYRETHRIVIYYGIQDSDLLACATQEYILATAQLSVNLLKIYTCFGLSIHKISCQWRLPISGRKHIWIVFPKIPKEHMHKTPGPYRITSLVFLSDVESRGGGTIVWPKSHRKIR